MIKAVVIVFTLLLLWASLAGAQPMPLSAGAPETRPEWTLKVARGERVDFNAICAPSTGARPRQQDTCQLVSAELLQQELAAQDS